MKNRGFTLIELMIVIAIIMILAWVGTLSLSDRFYKNEKITLKTSIPTLLQNSTLRVYEKGTAGAVLTVNAHAIRVSNVGTGAEVNSSVFSFSTSPASITSEGAINSMGAFMGNFDIIVTNKDGQEAMVFRIKTNENLGVFNVTTIDNED